MEKYLISKIVELCDLLEREGLSDERRKILNDSQYLVAREKSI